MKWQKRVRILVAVMVALAAAVSALSITVLYMAAFKQQAGRQLEIAQSQAHLIGAVARFDRVESDDFPGGGGAATLSQIHDAHESYHAFGKTTEFLLAKREGERTIYLLRHRGSLVDEPEEMSMIPGIDSPMLRALDGRTGTMATTDYRGNRVLAAYAPIKELRLGIVVKTDLSEIRAPFVRASLLIFAVAAVLIWLGARAFLKVLDPIIADLLAKNAELKHFLKVRESVEAMSRHDLKNPLGPIIGLPDLLLDQDHMHEEDREILRAIKENGFRMLKMIEEALDMVRLENGSYELKLTQLDIARLIGRVFKDLNHQASERDIELEINGRTPDPQEGNAWTFELDEALVYSMLANLVRNAVEAAPESSKVTVSLERAEQLLIAVHNRGEVPRIVRDRFFEKYATSGKANGTGLGTYMSRLIAETLGGKIEMATSGHGGTTVTVALPI